MSIASTTPIPPSATPTTTNGDPSQQQQSAWLAPVSKQQANPEPEQKKKRKIRWYHTKCFLSCGAITLVSIAILTIILSFVLFVKHNHLLFVCGSAEFLVISGFEATILFCAAVIGFKLNEWYKQYHSEAATETNEDLKLKYSDNPAREKLIMKFQNTTVVISLCLIAVLTLIYLGVFSALIVLVSKTHEVFSGTEVYPSLLDRVVVEKEKTTGVTHIHAKNDYDLFFAQGVMTAKERLFQMEVLRRMGRGTLAALIGEDAVEMDKWSRTLGFLRVARKNLKHLDSRTNTTLTAFFDGVNSYLKSNPTLPPEYAIIFNKKTIHYFEPVDALVFWKLNSLDMSTNAHMENLRFAALRKNFTTSRVMQFYPQYPRTWPEQFKAVDLNITATKEEADALDAKFSNNAGAYIPKLESEDKDNNGNEDEEDNEGTIVEQEGDILSRYLMRVRENHPLVYKSVETFFNKKHYESYFASNAWVVSGEKTASGKPMMANDPHLSLTAPLPFLIFHLESDTGLDVLGASYPLVPGIALGRTRNTSWAITSAGSDVQDLYVMQEPTDVTYMYNGSVVEYNIHKEEIHLDNTQSVTVYVKEGIYGPIVNSLFNLENALEEVALQWTALHENDTTMNAVIGIMYQENWWDFYNTMSEHLYPPMNFLYADTENNICSLVAGRVPIRKDGHSGLFPVSGNGTFDYNGYIPYQKMPFVCNPERNHLVAANAKIEPAGYPYFLGGDVGTKYRYERIEELLKFYSNVSMTMTNMKEIQLDTKSKLFNDLKPYIAKLKNQSITFNEEILRKSLERWDGFLNVGSKEASLFEMFHTKLWSLSVDELGVENSNIHYILNQLAKDTSCTPLTNKTCMAIAAEAFQDSIADLKVLSKSTIIPSWGVGIHSTIYNHPVFHKYTVGCFCDKKHYIAGGTDTINFSRVTDTTNLDSSHGVAFRQIVSMSDEDTDLYITPLGQSGNWLQKQYSNNLQVFAEGRYHSLKRTNYKVDSTLILTHQD